MTILLSIIVFLVIFSILVLIHELGHFWAARKAGILVEEFGFGLPPRLWGKTTVRQVIVKDLDGKKKKMEEKMIWSINWIPFGGFVKMFGEDDNSKEAKTNPRAFGNRPLGWRILVVCAGVIMNFLLGWFLLTIAYSVGAEPLILTHEDIQKSIDAGLIETGNGIEVVEVVKDGPADHIGLKEGDIIVAVENSSITSPAEFVAQIQNAEEKEEFLLDVKRVLTDGTMENFSALIVPNEEGLVGVFLSPYAPIEKVNKLQLPLWQAPWFAAKETVRLSGLTVTMLGKVVTNIVTKFKPPENVAGPVGIAQMTHKFVQLGDVIKVIVFMALISISLAVVNIMPFPALDGGRLLFLIYELFTGSKPNATWEAAIHTGGFVILLALIFLVTWTDFVRLFSN